MKAFLQALASVVAGLVLATASAVAAEPVDVRLISEPVLDDLRLPTTLAEAPDGRVFIGEKAGRVLEWTPGSETLRTVIDLSPTGADIVQSDKDRGLLGLAADPEFDDPASPGFRRLYVSFQSRFGPLDQSGVNGPLQPAQDCSLTLCPTVGRLVAIQVEDHEQTTGMEVISQNWCGEQPAHAIGALEWSSDRRALLVAAGDGVTSRVPGAWSNIGNPCAAPAGFEGPMKAQQVFGGIDSPGYDGAVVSFPLDHLRDPAGPDIPRIVAAGMRNPWRMAVDASTGDVFVANVGWNAYEEIERIPAQQLESGPPVNYGWPCAEGPDTFEVPGWWSTPYCSAARSAGTLRSPWLHYGSTDGPSVIVSCSQGRAVGPVEVIRSDSPLPAGAGSGLFFADYVRGCGWIAHAEPGAAPASGDIRLVSDRMPSITDALQTEDGSLYWLQILADDFAGPGKLNRLTTGVVARIDVTHAVSAGGTAALSAARSESSLAEPALLYEWDLDADGAFDDATGADAQTVIDEPRTVSVRVTDQFGRSDTTSAEARIGTAPTLTIRTEPAGGIVPANTRVRASALVDDVDADATAAATRWSVQIQHCQATCHTHPVLSGDGESITFTAEAHVEGGSGDDTYLYRVIARNTDRAGLVGVASRDIRVADPDPAPAPAAAPRPSHGASAEQPPAPEQVRETAAASVPRACPAPRGEPPRARSDARVRLSALQLSINQRISQAAVRRVNALAARVDGRVDPRPAPRAGGRIRLSAAQLRINQRISQAAVRRVNALAAAIGARPRRGARTRGAQARVSFTATQLLINQRISQAAIRRIRALEDCVAGR